MVGMRLEVVVCGVELLEAGGQSLEVSGLGDRLRSGCCVPTTVC
jgi:hypothetical protein